MTDKEIQAFKNRINVKAWKARNPEKVKAYKRIGYLRRKARLKQSEPLTLSPTMSTNTKPKAVLVEDKGWQDKYAHRIADFRKRLGELKNETGYVKGLGSYALYAIDHRRGQMVVIASEPTSADFAPYVTARALGDVCARYDHVVEYRDPGSNAKPKITIRVWELAQ